jgi:hypothetical protein
MVAEFNGLAAEVHCVLWQTFLSSVCVFESEEKEPNGNALDIRHQIGILAP